MPNPSSRRCCHITALTRIFVILVGLVLVLVSAGVHATSTTVFDVETNEEHQISMLTGSGVRPTVGWTLLSNGGMRITVAIKLTNLGWLGVGVSGGDGLGTSLMYGGRGGGAVIARAGQVNEPPVKEYLLLGPQTSLVTPFDATPISILDVQKCVSDFCVTEAQVCFGQRLCSDALRCAEQKYGQLSSSLNQSTSVASTVEFVSECAVPLSNPRDPDQVAALSALFNAAGCVISSCTKKIIDKGLKEASLNTSSYIQNTTTTTLNFVLSKTQIAGVAFNPLTTTFIVAYSPAQTANLFVGHTPQQRAYASVNLNTGAFTRSPGPSYLISHVVVTVIGFGILYPVSVVLRVIRLKKNSWISIGLAFLSVTFASIGCVIVSSFNTRNDYSSPHAIVSIVTLFAVSLYILFNILQPTESEDGSNSGLWEKIVLVGIKQAHIDAANRKEWSVVIKFLFRAAEFASLALICGSLYSGLMSIADSSVQVEPSYQALAFVGIGFCILAAVAVVATALFFNFRAASGLSRKTLAGTTGQSSSNPVFSGEMEAAENVESEVVPIFLSWEKVTFHAKQPKVKEPKQILKNAIGICSPRTLTAVLGPSGAGKSTLMEILALRSRKAPSEDSKILINGTAAGAFPGIHRLIGYVPQSDVLHQFLTVLETLQFTARLILPEAMGEQAKMERMLRVVAQLGIGHILDTRVGGDTVRGISGGEKRRVSIALQMLKSPSCLFLDEPTSGLDAHLALRLVKVLRELANEGRTIFATIHQPSAACFELFDRVVLLSSGYTVFSGSRTAALQFMKEMKRDVPPNWNPADWLLTVVDFERDERIVQNENGQPIYKNDAAAEAILRRKGLLSADARFKAATSMEALTLDVSELRDNIKSYYQSVNPSKLVDNPSVVEEIVSFALAKGLDALEKKLVNRYKVSILPFFKPKQTQNLEPCTWDELSAIILSFASSKYSFELVDKIRRAKEDARSSLARLSPGMNASYIVERMQSDGTTPSRGDADESVRSPTFGSPKSYFKSPKSGSTSGDESLAEIYSQPFMNQVRLLSRRSIRLVWRNPQAMRFQALQNIVFGLLLGALYSDVKFLRSSPFQQSIVMAIILAMVAFVTLSLGTQVAFNDRLVLEREMSDAMYSPIAHFLQRLLIGIPVAVVISMCLILPSYFWVGLQADAYSFFFFCLVNSAVVFLFDSVVFALTLFVNDVNSAYAIGNFYEALTIFFSGVFIPIYAMPVYFRWIYFLSPFSYAFGAVVINEFEGTENQFSIGISGVVVRSEWPNLLILFGMGLAWRALGFFGVIRLFRRKRPGSLDWHHNVHEKKKKSGYRRHDNNQIIQDVEDNRLKIVTKVPGKNIPV